MRVICGTLNQCTGTRRRPVGQNTKERTEVMTFTLNAPMLDFLVLSVIAEGDAYGYQISQIIKRAAGTKDSALYPILKRLQENGLVDTYDEQYQGRNRKYYRITPEGRTRQAELLKEWETYKFIIDDIVKGGIPNESDRKDHNQE